MEILDCKTNLSTDYTKNPPEERELTIQERLLLEHMKTIGYQQRLLKKIEYLENRINILEQVIQELTNNGYETITDLEKLFL